MQKQDDYDEKIQAHIEAFRKRERKDKLDSAIEMSLELQACASHTHNGLPVEARARRRAAEAYLIARGVVAVVALRWNYKFADEEVRPFTSNSALLHEFYERILECKSRDEAAQCVERILGNVRQILDEPSVSAGRQQTAA